MPWNQDLCTLMLSSMISLISTHYDDGNEYEILELDTGFL
jgi:hypothetical protein